MNRLTGEVSGVRKLALTKTRISATGPISDFNVENMVLGEDEDGDDWGEGYVFELGPCDPSGFVKKAARPAARSEVKDDVLWMIGDLTQTHKRYINLAGRKNHAPDVFAEIYPHMLEGLDAATVQGLKAEWKAAIIEMHGEGALKETTKGTLGKKKTWFEIVAPEGRGPEVGDEANEDEANASPT
jgi:hypothetical protein